eukprot:12886501-Alexandrium_andersonii.AAC.1
MVPWALQYLNKVGNLYGPTWVGVWRPQPSHANTHTHTSRARARARARARTLAHAETRTLLQFRASTSPPRGQLALPLVQSLQALASNIGPCVLSMRLSLPCLPMQ